MKNSGGGHGAEEKDWQAPLCHALSEEKCGGQREKRCEEDREIRDRANPKRVGETPDAGGDGKAAPTRGEQGTTKEQSPERLKIWRRIQDGASQHAEGKDEADDEAEWEVAVHDAGRIVDFSTHG